MTQTNPYEMLHRERKTAALITEIESQTRPLLGLDSPESYAQLIEIVEGWEGRHWAQLATCAGTRPPSETTQAVVLKALRARGCACTGRAS